MIYRNMGFSWVLLFITITSLSQTKQYRYYFDKDLNSTNPANAIFNGIGKIENGRIKLMLYNTLNKNLVFTGHFTDSTLQVRDGFFQSYHTNASNESEGNYLKGKEEGLWQRWDSLGHIIDSSIYNNGEKIMEAIFAYKNNGTLYSFIVNNIKADLLQKTYYDDREKVVSEISFTGQRGFEKVYKNGVMLRADSVFTRAEIEAFFPGGEIAWNEHIMNQVQRHSNELGNNEFGTCWVKFTIGIDGKVTNVEATTMRGIKLYSSKTIHSTHQLAQVFLLLYQSCCHS